MLRPEANAEHQPISLTEFEFPAPKSADEATALFDLVKLDLAGKPSERQVPTELAASLLEAKIAEIEKHLQSLKVTGEEDVAASCITGAEAIAGLLSLQGAVSDPDRIEQLTAQMNNWLERASLSQAQVAQMVPIHEDWDESLATIMSQSTRFFSDPNHGPVPYTWIIRRTLDRMEINHRISVLQDAVTSNDGEKLGLAFAGAFNDESDPERLAVKKAEAFFVYSTKVPHEDTATKKHALENALIILASNFVDLSHGTEPVLDANTLKGQRIYGQAIHDYTNIRHIDSIGETISDRLKAQGCLTSAIVGFQAMIQMLDNSTIIENHVRDQLSNASVDFQDADFNRKRDELADMYKRMFEMTIRQKNYQNDIKWRDENITATYIEEKSLRTRLDAVLAGLDDPEPETDTNPDDKRSLEEKLNTRLASIRSTRVGMLTDINSVRNTLYDLDVEIKQLETAIDAKVKEVDESLAPIVNRVRSKTDPLRAQLAQNRLGHVEYGNETYYTLRNALDLQTQRDLANHFGIIYSVELSELRAQAIVMRQMAAEALKNEYANA